MYNEVYLPNDLTENYLSNNNNQSISIDQDDLYIVENPSHFDPPYEIVVAYAKKLGFDILNDPPELLAIAKKYLLIPTPENILRAFYKETLELLYINEITGEIFFEIEEIDLKCKNEYENEKKKLKEKKKKKKGKKKKKKSANKNSNAYDNDDNDKEDEKDKKIFDEEDKKILIKKKKEKLKEYKNKLKMKYINNKNKSIENIKEEYNLKIISAKNKIKNEFDNDIIKPFESKLKIEYDNIIEKYKKELKEKYEKELQNDSMNEEYNNDINKLNNKIKEIQNEITKQKEKKEKKIMEEKIKIEKEMEIESKKFKNKLNSKKDELSALNEQKILKIKNEFNNKYQNHIEKYEINYNKNNNNNIFKEDSFESKDIYNNNNLILKEANEIFEQNKLEIKKELEEKLNKDLIEYKAYLIQENKKKSEKIKNDEFNLENKYNEELENLLKKQKDNNNLLINEADNINNKIKIKYSLDNMNKGINEFLKNIKRIFNEEKMEEFIEEKNSEIFFKLIKIKSLFDILEKDYIKNYNEIEYYQEIIRLIIENISVKNNNNENILINDLIKKIGEITNKQKEKFRDKLNKKLFPNLERNVSKYNKSNKLNYKQKGNLFNNSLLNKKSFYEQSSKNAINTTVILDNFKNVVFKTNRNNKSSLSNFQLLNSNNNINNVSLTNRKPILSNNNISVLNNIENNNIMSNNFNRTYINQNPQTFRSNIRNQNDINNLKQNEEEKAINENKNDYVNLELNNIQTLNENIRQNLSQENNDKCEQIHNFLNKEYNSLNKRIKDLNNTNYINSQLNSLRESNHLKKYRNIFSNIYEKEQKKSEDISNHIYQSKNNLDKIRKNCNSLFTQINSGLIHPNLIHENLGNIMEEINEYNYKSRKSISMDNRINNNNKYRNNIYNLTSSRIIEEKKEDNNDIKFSSFPLFCNSYDPFYLSEKINNNFSHSFFNFKKNFSEIRFKLMSSKLL